MSTATEENGTALAVYPASQFGALAVGSAHREAIDAILETGEKFDLSSLPQVKTPAGGGTTWMIPGPRGEQPAKSIVGVMAGYFMRGVLWPSDDPAPGTMPVLTTSNLETARIVGDVPPAMRDEIDRCKNPDGTVAWSKLSYTQFGSGKGGIGCRAKEQRVLFILRQTDAVPICITAQPGSLKLVKTFITGLANVPIVPWRAIVELKLDKATSRGGQPYAQISPQLVGQLTPEDGAINKQTWWDTLRKSFQAAPPPAAGDDGEE